MGGSFEQNIMRTELGNLNR